MTFEASLATLLFAAKDTKKSEANHTKKSEAKTKDRLLENRPSRGQGQECSRRGPRTKTKDASVLQRKKKSPQKKFSRDLQTKQSFSSEETPIICEKSSVLPKQKKNVFANFARGFCCFPRFSGKIV